MRLQDKVAIVTGGARGIGECICQKFVAEGAKVMIVDILAERGAQLARQLSPDGSRAAFYSADVSIVAEVKQAIAQTIAHFGRIDVVCNNAGIRGQKALTHEASDEDWQRVIGINLSSQYWFCKYTIPHFMEQGGGVFVNTASATSIIAMRDCAAYVASKTGVLGLTRAIALDYGQYKIRANCICPGVVDTEMVLKSYEGKPDPESAMNERWAMQHPLGRMVHAEDVANAAIFLASDESSFISGAHLEVDGGFVINGELLSLRTD